MSVRLGVASLDDVLSYTRTHLFTAEVVVMSWDRKYRRAAVMGMLDEQGSPMDVRADVLAQLTSMLAQPLELDSLRLAYPDAKLHHSGQIMLNVPVDEPVWSRVLTNVLQSVHAGLRVSTEDLRDALWVTLEAAGLPSGSLTSKRTTLFPEVPDAIEFTPESLSHQQNGAGQSMAWEKAFAEFAHPDIAHGVVAISNELAVRQQREQNLGATEKVVFTRAVVNT